MQKCPVYLYHNSFEVILDLDQNLRVNNIMYQHDLKIQKGLKNKVQIQVKNSDQKRIHVSSTDTSFVFSMFDVINQRQVVSKELTIIDEGTTATRGLALLELNESDTLDLDTGKYSFTVARKDKLTRQLEPTYANTYYGVAGTIELRQDNFPILQPSRQVLGDSATINEFQIQYNHDNSTWEYYSGNLYANPEFNGNNALHTMAFYLTRYKGRIIIEASQENDPGFFGNFAILSNKAYSRFTGIDYQNFYGVWSYVRIRYIPDTDPVSGDNRITSYRGFVDKLLYRS
jgi:hypothetical protein